MERFEYPSRSEIPKILEDHHVDHPGINAMAASIRQRYFWDKMYQTIEQFVSLFRLSDYFNMIYGSYMPLLKLVKSCHSCQITSAKIPQP